MSEFETTEPLQSNQRGEPRLNRRARWVLILIILVPAALVGSCLVSSLNDSGPSYEMSESEAQSQLQHALDGSQEASREAAQFVAAGNTSKAREVLIKRQQYLEDSIVLVNNNKNLRQFDKDRVVKAMRAEQENLRQMLMRY